MKEIKKEIKKEMKQVNIITNTINLLRGFISFLILKIYLIILLEINTRMFY